MNPENCVYIADGYSIPAPLLSLPHRYGPYIDKVLVNHGLLQDRVAKIAADLASFYAGESVTFLVLLKGASHFARDLIECIDQSACSLLYNLEFIRVKSYCNDQQANVQVHGLDKVPISGKNVVIVEDIIDSGRSLLSVKPLLLAKSPKSLRVACLFFKRNPENTQVLSDFTGFCIPNEWIVGYNMDYNERFRDLHHVGVLNDRGKAHFRVSEA
jgi:hypoxanthine phosphoribosyltransferase